MRIASGKHNAIMVAGLGFALALVAHDLALPMVAISVFGLFDRFVGEPFIRSRITKKTRPVAEMAGDRRIGRGISSPVRQRPMRVEDE